jgi:hypothetical protein
MRLAKSRIAPLTEAEWTEEQRTLLQSFYQEGKTYNVLGTMTMLIDTRCQAFHWLVRASEVNRNGIGQFTLLTQAKPTSPEASKNKTIKRVRGRSVGLIPGIRLLIDTRPITVKTKSCCSNNNETGRIQNDPSRFALLRLSATNHTLS